MQGHSAANAMPVIAANRIGTEDGQVFCGQADAPTAAETWDKLVDVAFEDALHAFALQLRQIALRISHNHVAKLLQSLA